MTGAATARFGFATLALAAGCSGEPRGACDPDPVPGRVGSVCGFHNPEDLALTPDGRLLIASQMSDGSQPGSLAGLRLDPDGLPSAPPQRLRASGSRDPAPAKPNAPGHCDAPGDGLSPHGIAVQLFEGASEGDVEGTSEGNGDVAGSVRIAVVDHGEVEAVQFFELSGSDGRLRWLDCIALPPDTRGNDVAFLPGGGIAVTNYQPTTRGLRGAYYNIVGGMGGDTGSLLIWRAKSGWRELEGSDGSMPNGVAVDADGHRIYTSRTGTGDLLVASLEHGADVKTTSTNLGGFPDNLAWSPRGPLLAATHREGWRVALCKLGQLPCRTAWSLLEIDPISLRTRERLYHDGDVVGAVSSVVEVRGRYYFGSVHDDRIGVWRPAGD